MVKIRTQLCQGWCGLKIIIANVSPNNILLSLAVNTKKVLTECLGAGILPVIDLSYLFLGEKMHINFTWTNSSANLYSQKLQMRLPETEAWVEVVALSKDDLTYDHTPSVEEYGKSVEYRIVSLGLTGMEAAGTPVSVVVPDPNEVSGVTDLSGTVVY